MKEIEKVSKFSEIIPENQLTEIKGGDFFPIWLSIKLAEWEDKLNNYIKSLLEQK